MRFEPRFATLFAVVPSLMLPLALTGCSSSGRSTTIAQSWDERPRFFTAAPGEEHSRFSNVVWYDRAWGDRPGEYTTQGDYMMTYPANNYGTTSDNTTTYDNTNTTQYRTIPVSSQPDWDQDQRNQDDMIEIENSDSADPVGTENPDNVDPDED